MTHTAFDAESTGLGDHSGNGGGRHADDDEIGDDWARGQIRIGGDTLHRRMFLVHGQHDPPKWLSTRLPKSKPAIVFGSALAPTTAIA